jgi:uncharacterized protein
VALYFDTSALIKLIVAEPETEALRAAVRSSTSARVSSDLTRTELVRAVRHGAPERALVAREVLESLTLLPITTETFESASRLDPSILRALDALHLAAALTLGDDLEAVVTYDRRLADACRAHGVAVLAPR